MVPVKSFMVPKDKFITVERDVDVRTAGRVMRDRNIGSLFVTNEDMLKLILFVDCIVDIKYCAARISENMLNTFFGKTLDQYLCACKF